MSAKPRSERRRLMKPFEVLGIAAGCGLTVALVVILALQNFVFALIFGGAAFVVVVVLAMLLLGYKPNDDAPTYLDRGRDPEDRPEP